MGCCNNPKKLETDEIDFDLEEIIKNEPKLDLSENIYDLLEDNFQAKSSQITDVERIILNEID